MEIQLPLPIDRELPKPSSFHNTVNYSHDELGKFEKKAGTQEAIILELFMMAPPYKFTASQVYTFFRATGVNIRESSVKRAISNLCTQKHGSHLRITKDMKLGPYGVREHFYELINKKP